MSFLIKTAYFNLSAVFFIASSYPVSAENGANCAALFSKDIC